MQYRSFVKIFGIMVVTLLLAGCMGDEIREKVASQVPTVEQGIQQSQQPASAVSYDPLQVTNQVWAGDKSVRLRRGLPLPSTLEMPKAVTLVSGREMTLSEIATLITMQTGISVRLTDGAEQLGNSDVAAAKPAAITSASTKTPTTGSGGNAAPMTLAYEGSLSGLLDVVAGHFGTSWKYDGAAVVISRYETRTFVVEAMPGTTSVTDGLQADSGGSSSSSATTTGASSSTSALEQKASLTATLDYWAELQETVTTILGGVGAVKTSPSSGSITVITTPEIMNTVAQYIETENARNTRQVAITVELFTLSLSNTEDYGVDLNILAQPGLNWPAFGFNGPPTGLSSTTGDGLSVQVLSPTSHFAGTEGFIKAVSTLGNVSRIARIPMTTLNNRPASRRIGRDKAYLASSSTSQSGSSDFQSSTLTPGVIRQGFSLQVTPRILGDSRMLIQYSLSVIDLVTENIRSFSTTDGSSSIELPETNSRVFVQQALLNNGDSLVLAGFDDDRQSANNSGMGNPMNWLTGGKVANNKARDMLFLTITPREINVPQRLPNSF